MHTFTNTYISTFDNMTGKINNENHLTKYCRKRIKINKLNKYFQKINKKNNLYNDIENVMT